MVVTHHQLKSVGLILFDYRLPLLFVARCEAEGVLYVEPGTMHYMHMWAECALADPRRGDPKKLNRKKVLLRLIRENFSPRKFLAIR